VDDPISIDDEHADISMYHTPRRQEMLPPPLPGWLFTGHASPS
jgi:hypothetical protein